MYDCDECLIYDFIFSNCIHFFPDFSQNVRQKTISFKEIYLVQKEKQNNNPNRHQIIYNTDYSSHLKFNCSEKISKFIFVIIGIDSYIIIFFGQKYKN